jgi:hypothetical protein
MLAEDQPRVDAVAFRPEGKALASGSNDTTVLSWSPVDNNQGAGGRDRCGVRRAVLQAQVPAAALPCAIAPATCHGMTAPCPLGCAGRCDECRIDLHKSKGGKVIGETGLAGEDGQ